jgi:ferrous iron transport protein A
MHITLDSLPLSSPARLISVDWSTLAPDEAKRLVALGFEEGAEVEIMHRGIMGGRDPLAIKLGRMTVALRRVHARAMTVAPL